MTCSDYERLSVSDDPGDRLTLNRHAESCPDCAARLAFDERLTEATRSARQLAPDGVLERVLQEYRAGVEEPVAPTTTRRPILSLRTAVLVAATLTIGALGFLWNENGNTPTASEGLLSNADLQQVRRTEASLRHQHTTLVNALPRTTASPLTPAREEAHHLGAAIDELRQAVESNQKNRHLRERLLDLERRRNGLLAQIAEEQAG